MKPMNVVRRYGARIGGTGAALAVMSSPAFAAIDTSGVISEMTEGGVAGGAIIGAALVFGALLMVGFTIYRRLK